MDEKSIRRTFLELNLPLSVRVAAVAVQRVSKTHPVLCPENESAFAATAGGAISQELRPSLHLDAARLMAEVMSTARELATYEWRRDDHRKGDTPVVKIRDVERSIVIHLHGSPTSRLADARVRLSRSHRDMYGKPNILKPPHPSDRQMMTWAAARRAYQQAAYDSWTELAL